ncbi:MAG: hypothetical protein ACP5QS_05480, partial [bacterium]
FSSSRGAKRRSNLKYEIASGFPSGSLAMTEGTPRRQSRHPSMRGEFYQFPFLEGVPSEARRGSY